MDADTQPAQIALSLLRMRGRRLLGLELGVVFIAYDPVMHSDILLGRLGGPPPFFF